jgi:hypothetical protein
MRSTRSKAFLRERATIASSEIAAAFELLRREAPAAAFLFARTLVNGRALVEDETKPRSEKIVILQTEIEKTKELAGVDAGLCVLGMEFMQILLAAEERDTISSFGYSAAFGEIAQHGERYREIEARDRLPPADSGSRAVLAKRGCMCLGEVIDTLTAECDAKGLDRSSAEEPIQTLLALFDLRAEAASKLFRPNLERLQAALGSR